MEFSLLTYFKEMLESDASLVGAVTGRNERRMRLAGKVTEKVSKMIGYVI